VIRASQKLFTEDEAIRLTGLCMETLRAIATTKHLGFIQRAAEAAGEQAGRLLFTHSDLMILNLLTHGERVESRE
jgi:hypothetical protein